MPTNCSAAKQLPQFYKHSKSADLLRKSLLSHVWRVPSSKALSCKHERLFDILTLASYNKTFKSKIQRHQKIFHWKFFFEESYPHLPQIPCGLNICSKPIQPIFSQITHCFVPIPLQFACETDKVSVCHHTFQYHSTAPHASFQSGFHVEAGQKFLVCRNLRYSQKSIV